MTINPRNHRLPLAFAMLPILALAASCLDPEPADPRFRCTDVPASLPAPTAIPANPDLPSPFVTIGAMRIDSTDDWFICRRPELGRLFKHYVFGNMPDAPKVTVSTDLVDTAFFSGAATLKLMTLTYPPAGTPAIQLLLVTPNSRQPAPVLLGLNFHGNQTVLDDPRIPITPYWVPDVNGVVTNHQATEATRGTFAHRWPIREMIARGYGVATLYHGDLDPDTNDFTDGVHPHFLNDSARGANDWGSIGAWAWGLSRAMDALERDPQVDTERVGVLGHSRNGKAALLAGALDDRFSLVISNQSGCTGAAISRGKLGESVAIINGLYGYWFASIYNEFSLHEDLLPLDQHLLLAMVAPRKLLILSAEEDDWSDPASEFRGTAEASKVYEFVGQPGLGVSEMPAVNTLTGGSIAYHVRPGGHSIGLEDWNVMADYADQVW